MMPFKLPKEDAASLMEAALPGLRPEIEQVLHLLQDFVATQHNNPALAVRGMVLEGPSGVGKTTLVKELAKHGGLPAQYVSCPNLFGTDRGDAERNVEGVFRACTDKYHGPSVLVLDEVDLLGKDRDRAKHVTDVGVLSMLLECFDCPKYASIFVIAITVNASLLDASLLQPGRLEVTLCLGAPTLQKRYIILEALLQRLGTTTKSVVDTPQLLESLTRRTRGFTGADLSRLCTEALGAALRRGKEEEDGKRNLQIQDVDWDTAFENARPTDIPWSSPEGAQLTDLVGMDDVMRTVTEAVLLPLSRPDALVAMGVPRASFGVLLHGPPGTGKSTLGRALAAAAQPYASFLSVECPELVNKVVGESERAVARLFQTARQAAPCILFLDHIEAIAGKRGYDSSSEQTMDRLLSTLLVEMDGLASGGEGRGDEMIVVVGATNHLSMLDEAILRPGRLDLHMKMDLPDVAARTAIFQNFMRPLPLSFDEEEEEGKHEAANFSDVAELAHTLAQASEGMSGADIQGACQEAALLGLREDLDRRHLRPRHLLEAMALQQQQQQQQR